MNQKKLEQNRLKARYLVETVGLENAAQGLIVSVKTLQTFVETGEVKSTKLSGLNEYFCEIVLYELSKRYEPKNYDDAGLEEIKAGNRKGGAGGGSNNAFSTSVSDTYL